MKKLIINLEDEGDYDTETIVEEVLRLIKEGYTSGYNPNWKIEEV